MRFSILLAAVAASVTVASPTAFGTHVLHESREHLSNSWARKHRAPADAVLPVRIGLTQSNLHKGHDLLMEVSRHDSPKYGQHYTQEEIEELFAPSRESVDAVRSWLESAGVHPSRVSQSENKQWLQFDAPVAELEKLINAEYHFFEHEHTGQNHVSCDEYHLPQKVQEHVDYVTPGVRLMAVGPKTVEKREMEKRDGRGRYKLPILEKPLPISNSDFRKVKSDSSTPQLCNAIASPACIARMYNITTGKRAAAGNQLGIFEDLNDHYSQQDLNLFFEDVYPTIPQGTHPLLEGIDGAIGPVPVSQAGGESDLDFQISYPIIWPQNSILFQTDDQPTEVNYTYYGFLNNFFDGIDGSYCSFVYKGTGPSNLDPPYPDKNPGGYTGRRQCGAYKATNVISISYGGAESDLPVKYQKRQCAEIMKLGMQGVSVVVSSGDYGVAIFPGDPSPNGCLPASDTQNGTIFAPDFPASCPYITALGSTYLPPGGDVNKDEEVATTRFPSGGGFSNIYPIPDYQKAAVENYLTKYPPPYPDYQTTNSKNVGANGGIYNSAGRGFPDFSAVGDNVLIYNLGRPRTIGGTSASAPAFAAILTRINEERIHAGKSTVGFVNPTLYANPQVLHDITVGTNPGCGTNGFSASPGWDPVTGVGTPNYPAMLKLFLSLP